MGRTKFSQGHSPWEPGLMLPESYAGLGLTVCQAGALQGREDSGCTGVLLAHLDPSWRPRGHLWTCLGLTHATCPSLPMGAQAGALRTWSLLGTVACITGCHSSMGLRDPGVGG